MIPLPASTAAIMYEQQILRRQPFLRRAWTASALTLPFVLPNRNNGGASAGTETRNDELATPYQSVGARGVNNITSKLLLSILPPTSPFFRFQVDKAELEALSQQDEGKAKLAEVQESLAEMERRVMDTVEEESIRVATFEAFTHLVVTGNALAYLPDTGGMRVFPLDQYVVDRDPMGKLHQIITLESMTAQTAPPAVLEAMKSQEQPTDPGTPSDLRPIEVFTWAQKIKGSSKWKVMQQLRSGAIVPGSEGEWDEDDLPYIPLRLSHISGESYGRGLVEQYEGDLRSLEAISQSILEGVAASVKLLILVDPNGTTRISDIDGKPNGAVVSGNNEEVSALTLDKQADLTVADRWAQNLEQRVSAAFLLNSSVTRQAERVTAEEIRLNQQELEDTLGGPYSTLTQDFQLPLVIRLTRRLEKNGKLPKLRKGLVKPAIVTGVEALGRGHDLQRMQVASDLASRIYGPEVHSQVTDPAVGIQRIYTAAGVDTDGLILTPEQRAQNQQQAQLEQAGQQIVPEFAKAAASQAVQGGGPPQQ